MAAKMAGKTVGPVGYGMTGVSTLPVSDATVKLLKCVLDSGANLWNAGEFYGTPDNNSLTHLRKYFTTYPEDADRVVVNIKGALSFSTGPDNSDAGIRGSVERCLAQLGGAKRIDVFECARIDPRVPVEDMMRTLAALVAEGKIGAIGLSEVGAATIRRAHAVHPVASVEVEVSLWAREPLTNGVAAACAELGIPIVAYCPIGRGIFTGRIRSLNDLPEGDWRRGSPRFHPGALEHNLELVDEVVKLAERKGCTPAQLSLAWVKSLSGREGMPVFIPIPGSTSEDRVRENAVSVELTLEEQRAIDELLDRFTVAGTRYPEKYQALCEG